MTDVFSRKKRSYVMSRIRSKNTKIDLSMREILSDLNIHHEMYPRMNGSPDFILRERKIAIFCDGDFWHGYKYHEKKKLSKKFWREKIEGNMARDRVVSGRLRRCGWSVLRFWEHDIEDNPDKCRRRILRKIDELQS